MFRIFLGILNFISSEVCKYVAYHKREMGINVIKFGDFSSKQTNTRWQKRMSQLPVCYDIVKS